MRPSCWHGLGISLLLMGQGCSPVDDGAAVPDAEVLQEQHALDESSPWKHVFAVRGSGTSFVVNPLEDAMIECPDGVKRAECVVSAIRLSATQLSASRQRAVLARIAGESADEGAISVILKGGWLTIRDHRTQPPTTTYTFNATVVHWAPTARAHAPSHAWVEDGRRPDGHQSVTWRLNPELRGGRFYPRYPNTRLFWVGPGTGPSSFSGDTFISVRQWRYLDIGAGLGNPVHADVDQYFTRVSQGPGSETGVGGSDPHAKVE
jgi:hypothetical protein